MDAPRPDDDLRQAITTETQRLAELDVETQQVQARLEALHAELTLADASPEQALIPPRQNPNPSDPAPKSTAEKLVIFRRLFRGREDVYINRSSASGYSTPTSVTVRSVGSNGTSCSRPPTSSAMRKSSAHRSSRTASPSADYITARSMPT